MGDDEVENVVNVIEGNVDDVISGGQPSHENAVEILVDDDDDLLVEEEREKSGELGTGAQALQTDATAM